VCAISLTAGDWDIGGKAAFSDGGTTMVNYILGSISTTSATLDEASFGQGARGGSADRSFAVGSAFRVLRRWTLK
jgi:hypothetical protein